jgi:hypothetical protein
VGVDLDVWTAYTPTWTASGTAPALGNGTIVGRYKQIGKVVAFTIKLTAGSTTTFGTLDWRFTLPITAYDTTYQFAAIAYDSSATTTGWYQARGVGDYGGSTSYFSLIVNTTNANSTSVTSANPMTWASGDILTVSGTYEAA